MQLLGLCHIETLRHDGDGRPPLPGTRWRRRVCLAPTRADVFC